MTTQNILLGPCGCCGEGRPPGRAVFSKQFFSGICGWKPSAWGTYLRDFGQAEFNPATGDFNSDIYAGSRYLTRTITREWQAYDPESGGDPVYLDLSETEVITIERKNGRIKRIEHSNSCDALPLYTWEMAEDGTVAETNRLPVEQGGDGTGIVCELLWDNGSSPVAAQYIVSGTTFVYDQYYGDGSYPTLDGRVHDKTTTSLTDEYSQADVADDGIALLAGVDFNDSRFDSLSTDVLFVFWRGDYGLAGGLNDGGIFGATDTVTFPRSTSDGSDLTDPVVNATGWDVSIGTPAGWLDWLYGNCYGYDCFPSAPHCGFTPASGMDGGASSLKHSCAYPGSYKLLTQADGSLQWGLFKKSTPDGDLYGNVCELQREEQLDSEGDVGNPWSGNEDCNPATVILGTVWTPSDIAYDWGVLNVQHENDTEDCCQNSATPFDLCCTP